MEHPVVGAHIRHLPTILVLQEVIRVAAIAVDDVIAFLRSAHDNRRGMHRIPHFPDLQVPIHGHLSVAHPGDLVAANEVDDVGGGVGSRPGAMLIAQHRPAGIIGRRPGEPAMLNCGGRGVVPPVVESGIEGVEHPVVGAHIRHLPTVFVFEEVIRVAGIAVDHVMLFLRGAHDNRRGMDRVSHFPDLQAPIHRHLPVAEPGDLVAANEVDDIGGGVRSSTGP